MTATPGVAGFTPDDAADELDADVLAAIAEAESLVGYKRPAYLSLIDPALMEQVQAHLADASQARGRKDAGNLFIQWLAERGEFVWSGGARCYVRRSDGKHFRLDSEEWGVYVYRLTGCNPASVEHRYLVADCNAAALEVQLEAELKHGRLIHWASEAFEPQPPIDWVVQDLYAVGSVSVFYGDPGAKKTWTLLDQGICVALGKAWLGRFTTKQGTVLILDEESGPRRMNRRLAGILRGHCADPSIRLAYTTLQGFDIRNPQHIADISLLLLELKPVYVLVDALADVVPGADENSSQEMMPGILALRRLAETHQCAIVVIHHSNRAGGFRGTMAIKGGVDLLLKVSSKPKSSLIEYEMEKARDTEEFRFAATITFSDDPDVVTLTEASAGVPSVSLKASESKVLAYVTAHPGATRQDIIGSVQGITSGTAGNALTALAKAHLIRRTNEGSSGTAATYERVPDDPWAALE